ncbi:MAG: alkane 1-monooxygenase [Flavobacteriales bacterium]|nr:alkane 1-monooxygenase [Flavobacteriales bacterium]
MQAAPLPLIRNRLHWRALRYALSLAGPLFGWLAFTQYGLHTWGMVLFSFVLVPVLDLLLRPDHGNLSQLEAEMAVKEPLFDLLLYVLVPVHWALLLLFLSGMDDPLLAPLDRAGRIATMGLLCGIYGINLAHELGHRANRWERDLARVLLLSSLYMHFIIEHNRGHHRRVATPEDPASACFGESVYAFWVRSIVFSAASAWRIERERMLKAGLSTWHWRNEMLQAILIQVTLLAFIAAVFGLFPLGAFVGAALIGILLLETVNYIEHYGLRRTKGAQGGYGRVRHWHSWNSDHPVGRLMLFELTRHSDHHYKASKKYQVLESHDEAPELPTGYPGMMLLSLVPPLWRAVVHPRLEKLVAMHDDLELAV